MAETAMIIVGAMLLVGGGIGAFSDDPDIYPRTKVFCFCILLPVGLGLLAIAACKVLNA